MMSFEAVRETALILKTGRCASDAIILDSQKKSATPTQHRHCSVTV